MHAVARPLIDLRRAPAPTSSDLSHDDNRETQLLYGEPVKILSEGDYLKVYAPLQDYTGYVLREEITTTPPTMPDCVITKGELYGALVKKEGRKIRFLDGTTTTLPHRPYHFHLPSLIQEAHDFLEIPYLWGGCSRKGIDCSGLIHLLYRSQGILLPRDAKDQVKKGVKVNRAKPGDAIYLYHANKPAHHVVLVASDKYCIEAPETGKHVRLLQWGDTIKIEGETLHVEGREPTYFVIKRFSSRPRSLMSAWV